MSGSPYPSNPTPVFHFESSKLGWRQFVPWLLPSSRYFQVALSSVKISVPLPLQPPEAETLPPVPPVPEPPDPPWLLPPIPPEPFDPPRAGASPPASALPPPQAAPFWMHTLVASQQT